MYALNVYIFSSRLCVKAVYAVKLLFIIVTTMRKKFVTLALIASMIVSQPRPNNINEPTSQNRKCILSPLTFYLLCFNEFPNALRSQSMHLFLHDRWIVALSLLA